MDRLENAAVFAASVLGVEPHAGQVRYLVDQHPTKVLVGGRRSGKTFALSIEVAYHAALAIRERRPFRQLLVAPSVDQARLLFDCVVRMLRSSPLGGVVESEVHSPFPMLKLVRDGVVLVRASHEGGRLLRGHSAHRVVVDESAYIGDRVIQEAVMPLLADVGGTLVLASTPGVKGALFHRLYEQGKDGTDPRVRSFTMETVGNPFVDAQYVAAQKEQLTKAQYDVEYGGVFGDQAGAIFKWSDVLACTDLEARERTGERRIHVGWDPARVKDGSAVVAVDVTEKPYRVLQVRNLRGLDYIRQTETVAAIAREHGKSTKVIVDATGGSALVELLRQHGVWAEGVTFTTSTKSAMVTNLAVLVERHAVHLPTDTDVLTELRYYEGRTMPSGHTKFGAPEGARFSDDLVTAIMLALYQVDGGIRASGRGPDLPPFLTGSMPYSPAAYVVPAGGLPDTWFDWN
jgi:phage terminase large subunit-like protein